MTQFLGGTAIAPAQPVSVLASFYNNPLMNALAQNYQTAYGSALAANQAQYNQINNLYKQAQANQDLTRGAINQGYNTLQNNLSGAYRQFQGDIAGGYNTLGSAVGTGYTGLQGSLGTGYQGAQDFLGIGYGNLANKIGTGYAGLTDQQRSAQQAALGTYQGAYDQVMGTINDIDASQRQAIRDAYAQQVGQMQQSALSRGIGNTTVTDSLGRGVLLDKAKAEVALSNQLAGTRAGYQANLLGNIAAYQNQMGQQGTALGQAGLGAQQGIGQASLGAQQGMQMAGLGAQQGVGLAGMGAIQGIGLAGQNAAQQVGMRGLASAQDLGQASLNYQNQASQQQVGLAGNYANWLNSIDNPYPSPTMYLGLANQLGSYGQALGQYGGYNPAPGVAPPVPASFLSPPAPPGSPGGTLGGPYPAGGQFGPYSPQSPYGQNPYGPGYDPLTGNYAPGWGPYTGQTQVGPPTTQGQLYNNGFPFQPGFGPQGPRVNYLGGGTLPTGGGGGEAPPAAQPAAQQFEGGAAPPQVQTASLPAGWSTVGPNNTTLPPGWGYNGTSSPSYMNPNLSPATPINATNYPSNTQYYDAFGNPRTPFDPTSLPPGWTNANGQLAYQAPAGSPTTSPFNQQGQLNPGWVQAPGTAAQGYVFGNYSYSPVTQQPTVAQTTTTTPTYQNYYSPYVQAFAPRGSYGGNFSMSTGGPGETDTSWNDTMYSNFGGGYGGYGGAYGGGYSPYGGSYGGTPYPVSYGGGQYYYPGGGGGPIPYQPNPITGGGGPITGGGTPTNPIGGGGTPTNPTNPGGQTGGITPVPPVNLQLPGFTPGGQPPNSLQLPIGDPSAWNSFGSALLNGNNLSGTNPTGIAPPGYKITEVPGLTADGKPTSTTGYVGTSLPPGYSVGSDGKVKFTPTLGATALPAGWQIKVQDNGQYLIYKP